jgi:hypothetical protein
LGVTRKKAGQAFSFNLFARPSQKGFTRQSLTHIKKDFKTLIIV